MAIHNALIALLFRFPKHLDTDVTQKEQGNPMVNLTDKPLACLTDGSPNHGHGRLE